MILRWSNIQKEENLVTTFMVKFFNVPVDEELHLRIRVAKAIILEIEGKKKVSNRDFLEWATHWVEMMASNKLELAVEEALETVKPKDKQATVKAIRLFITDKKNKKWFGLE